ncbi:MAG TPA: methyl-accepting chemotaxis protein, partial [Baekduia sp.]|nr:methyl-accepting chemotaxis protein [Baekduia sp.]
RHRADVSRSLASALSNSTTRDRADVRAIVRGTILDDRSIQSVWAAYRPDAFDGRDAAFAGQPGQSKSGLLATFSLFEHGKVSTTAFAGLNDADYSTVPLRTRRPYVSEPYAYGKVLWATFSAPILRDGRAIGIAGVDASMADLAKSVNRTKVLESGYAMLVTRSGTFIASPDAKLAGKSSLTKLAASSDEPALRRIAAATAAGRAGQIEAGDPFGDRRVLITWVPVKGTGWGYITVAPRAEVYAKVTALQHRLLIVAALVLALLVGSVLLLARRITRPVTRLVARLSELTGRDVKALSGGIVALAHGDLTHEVALSAEVEPVHGADEIADAERALNEAVETIGESVDAYGRARIALSETIGGVARDADLLGDSSASLSANAEQTERAVAEVAAGIESLARGAEQQVVLLDEARERARLAVEAMQTSAVDANAAATAATDAVAVVGAGLEAVDSAQSSMDAVGRATDDATGAIRRLAGRSEEIGSIVATISGIADQTNLLALNAAIEAARGGEQGRGFAVVAEQVRSLAEQSQEAARSIADLVGDMQADTRSAVDAVEAGSARTAETSSTVIEASEAFRAIEQAVGDVTTRANAITSSITGVAAELDRVRDHVDGVADVAAGASAAGEQISASTEQTAAAAQEVAASAQRLAGTADGLRTAVGAFRLGD